MKQGESNLGVMNKVFKKTEEERIWGVQNTGTKPSWMEGKERRRMVCPEAAKVGWPDHPALCRLCTTL